MQKKSLLKKDQRIAIIFLFLLLYYFSYAISAIFVTLLYCLKQQILQKSFQKIRQDLLQTRPIKETGRRRSIRRGSAFGSRSVCARVVYMRCHRQNECGWLFRLLKCCRKGLFGSRARFAPLRLVFYSSRKRCTRFVAS